MFHVVLSWTPLAEFEKQPYVAPKCSCDAMLELRDTIDINPRGTFCVSQKMKNYTFARNCKKRVIVFIKPKSFTPYTWALPPTSSNIQQLAINIVYLRSRSMCGSLSKINILSVPLISLVFKLFPQNSRYRLWGKQNVFFSVDSQTSHPVSVHVITKCDAVVVAIKPGSANDCIAAWCNNGTLHEDVFP